MAQTNDSQEQVTINVETLQPVTRTLMTIGALPTSYLISMTYEEQLLWLQNYLIKTVIPAINNNAEATEEVQNIVLALQDYINDYFNNLDVQEEINNKLDELVADGTLTRLIGEYVQPLIDEQNQEIDEQNQEIAEFKTSVNSQIAQQNAQIQSVASGSPLVASSVSEMTDTTRVYVNTTDGYWYYYNGTTWTQGGVYQATSISDNSIVETKIKNNNVTNNKRIYFDDVKSLATSVVNDKKLSTSYDSTTYEPRYIDDLDYDVYIFNSTDIGNKIIYVPYTEVGNNYNVIYGYILNTSKTNYNNTTTSTEIIKNNGFMCASNIIINKDIICISVPKNNPMIFFEDYFSEINFKNNSASKQLVKASTIIDKVTADKISNIYNCINENGITVTHNNYIGGYSSDDTPTYGKSFQEAVLKININTFSKITEGKLKCKVNLTHNNIVIVYKANTRHQMYSKSTLATLGFLNDDILNVTAVLNYLSDYSSFDYMEITINNDTSNISLYYEIDEDNGMANIAEVILPNNFKVVQGNYLTFFHQNIIKNINTNNCANIEINNTNNINLKNVSIYKNDISETINGYYQPYYQQTKNRDSSKTINIQNLNSNAGSGLNKKVMFIGDSLTSAGKYENYLFNKFSTDSMSIEMVGTRGNTNKKHEGRGGWSAYKYCNISEYQGNTNSFLNPSTNKFDFSYYVTETNIIPDYVFINLGTNDINENGHNSEEQIIGYYNTMINSIKNYNSNIKIVLWLPPCKGIKNNLSNLKYTDRVLTMITYLINNFKNKENQNIYLCPVYCSINPDEDFNTEEINVNGNTFTSITDMTHPNDNGYDHIGEVIYYWIKYLGTL